MTKHRDSSLDDEQDSVEMLQAEIEEGSGEGESGVPADPAHAEVLLEVKDLTLKFGGLQTPSPGSTSRRPAVSSSTANRFAGCGGIR
ncbi:branched chain amino acid ABC transporter [Mycobacteroides abscessus subsp. abscessus]|nr:branched chain amino acid ABC transporter [Mycobacteroides abscessus subsp. abscessus]